LPTLKELIASTPTEQEENRVTEFRVNRIKKAKMLPNRFSPEAHTRSFAQARVRLSKNACIAYGKTIIPDPSARIERVEDGGAVITGTTPSVFWTVREISSLGPDAEVLGGEELKRELTSFLKGTLAKYEQ
jgi:predicted DNA-binding transcriptional regulator YafY